MDKAGLVLIIILIVAIVGGTLLYTLTTQDLGCEELKGTCEYYECLDDESSILSIWQDDYERCILKEIYKSLPLEVQKR